MRFEYAKEFHLDPQTIAATVKVRTWQRWLAKRQAEYSAAAWQASKHYEDLAKMPPEVREAMAWAIERDTD